MRPFTIEIAPEVSKDDFSWTCSAEASVDRKFREFDYLLDDNYLWVRNHFPKLIFFVDKLLADFVITGFLTCNKKTRYESCQVWLTFARDKKATESIESILKAKADRSVESVLDVTEQDNLFWPMPDSFLQNCSGDQLGLRDSFLWVFGGLRSTPPHFGNSFFSASPDRIVLPELIKSRDFIEEQWLGSMGLYTVGNCNYVLVSKDEQVGYLPFEREKRVNVYQDSLQCFLIDWLETSGRINEAGEDKWSASF